MTFYDTIDIIHCNGEDETNRFAYDDLIKAIIAQGSSADADLLRDTLHTFALNSFFDMIENEISYKSFVNDKVNDITQCNIELELFADEVSATMSFNLSLNDGITVKVFNNGI
jgi:hypothetical protein